MAFPTSLSLKLLSFHSMAHVILSAHRMFQLCMQVEVELSVPLYDGGKPRRPFKAKQIRVMCMAIFAQEAVHALRSPPPPAPPPSNHDLLEIG